jgi:hypothetical protein
VLRFSRLRRGDVAGILIVIVVVVIGFGATLYPRMIGQNRSVGFGPDWECSEARFGFCFKKPRVETWPQTEVRNPD